uniref:CSON012437 protein n=1 Tax=Culicoides sonorensis TaxID=179676 RepID=A0A336KJQ5_CULSO
MAQNNIARGIQKLFIGNLPWTVGSNELKMYFSQFGHVQISNVIFDRKSGISRGYAFITFSTRDGYNAAANKEIHRLEGRKLTVQPASIFGSLSKP